MLDRQGAEALTGLLLLNIGYMPYPMIPKSETYSGIGNGSTRSDEVLSTSAWHTPFR